MKTRSYKSRQRVGSVLMITLLIALGLGVVLASYLLMIREQYVSVVRSQAWHSALTMAEAGVEEALAQLNSVTFTNSIPSGNGWILADGFYQMVEPRMLFDGQYGVAFTPNVPPTIYATGYTTVPTLSATLERVVEAKTVLAPLFSLGAAVRGAIKMNGNQLKLSTDSFDSTNPHYSGPGGVYEPSKARENGDIGSVGGILNADEVDIHGRALLGAAATNVWIPAFDVTGAIDRDFNADFPDVPPPFESCDRLPLPGRVGSADYTYSLSGFNYQTDHLNGSIYVTSNANAVLYVTGDANVSSLVIAPGASLKLYVGGANTVFGSDITPATAKSFQYFGLPGNTNIAMYGSLGSSGALVGTIYAPKAKFRAGERSSGGSTYVDFDLHGAIIVDSMDLRSDFKLHFDENLKNAAGNGGPVRGFVVTSWQELPPP